MSHRHWQRRFLADPEIIGKSVLVNRTPFTVVGVTATEFHGTEVTETVDVSLPLAMADRLSATGRPRPISSWWLLLMGRLKPGASREQVLAELQPIFNDTVVTSWAARPPETRDPWRSAMPVMRVNLRPGSRGSVAHGARQPDVRVCRRRCRPADRMRERGQPASGARRQPAPGDDGEMRSAPVVLV